MLSLTLRESTQEKEIYSSCKHMEKLFHLSFLKASYGYPEIFQISHVTSQQITLKVVQEASLFQKMYLVH